MSRINLIPFKHIIKLDFPINSVQLKPFDWHTCLNVRIVHFRVLFLNAVF